MYVYKNDKLGSFPIIPNGYGRMLLEVYGYYYKLSKLMNDGLKELSSRDF